jgi:hypothetical protein
MAEPSAPQIAVFDNRAKVDRALKELHRVGIAIASDVLEADIEHAQKILREKQRG